MKIWIFGLTLLLSSSAAFAGETIITSGKSSYLQVFQPQLQNMISHRVAEVNSFTQAAKQIESVCFGEIGQDYNIVDEKVYSNGGGGKMTVTTNITIDCERPINP